MARAVPAAMANTADFCGTSSNPHAFGFSARCSAGYHGAVGFTRFQLASGEGAEPICAVVKETSDGLGHDRSAPACDWATMQQSNCTSAYTPCSGYATDINTSDTRSFAGYGYFSYQY